jgi:hypothetical protein
VKAFGDAIDGVKGRTPNDYSRPEIANRRGPHF